MKMNNSEFTHKITLITGAQTTTCEYGIDDWFQTSDFNLKIVFRSLKD